MTSLAEQSGVGRGDNGSLNSKTESSLLVTHNAPHKADDNPKVADDSNKMEGSHGVNTLTAPPPSTFGTKKTGSDVTSGRSEETCGEACFRIFCYPMTLPLLFIKLFYFTFIGALGCILPFLSIYFKQQGLTPQQIGLISGLRPVIGFTSGPLWGVLADKYNIRRTLLLVSIVSWLGVFLALAFVSSPEKLDSCPKDIHPHRNVMHLKQPSGKYYTLQTSNGTENVTEEEYNILRESIAWIYEPSDVTTIFLTILFLILLGEFFQSPTTALSDAGTIQELGIDNLDYYGSQRAWGPVGWAFCSLIVGAIVASTRQQEVICGVELYFSDYYQFVYIFVVFMILAFICATQIRFQGSNTKKVENDEKVELKSPTDVASHSAVPAADARAVVALFLNLHYGSWLTTAFFVGICNGVIWGFLFWHLDNLGADQLMIGVASVVTCVSEFVMFFFVGPIIKSIGHINIMYSGLFLYSVRFAIYGSIVNPWWVLPAEVLQGVTFSCIWVSLTAYSALSVPSQSLATIQGILHGVYFGLGNGTGHLIGGIVIGYAGAPITFYAMSCSCIIALVLFFVAQQLSKKPDLTYEKFVDDS